jgi:hypothetical protein
MEFVIVRGHTFVLNVTLRFNQTPFNALRGLAIQFSDKCEM